MVRNELAALLWGAGILFLSTTATAVSFLSAAFLKRHIRRFPGAVRVSNESGDPSAGGTAAFSCALPRFCGGVPGILCEISVRGCWHSRRRFVLRIPVKAGAGRGCAGPLERGVYELTVRIEMGDMLSIACFGVSLSSGQTIRVLPARVDPVVTGPIPAAGGVLSAGETMRRSGDDFFDTRKYVPGDDIRRVNWKQFAHAREMILRVPERVPPPESRCRIVLDTAVAGLGEGGKGARERSGNRGRPAAVPSPGTRGISGMRRPRGRASSAIPAAIDTMAAGAAALSRAFMARGLSVSITLPDGVEYPGLSDPEAAAAILADLHEESGAGAPAPLPLSCAARRETVFLFVLPGGADRSDEIRALRSFELQPVIVVCAPSACAEEPNAGLFRYALEPNRAGSFFCLPHGRGRGTARAQRRAAAEIRAAREEADRQASRLSAIAEQVHVI
jgi:uncharacterized protein (DUF58 family)